ncbi:AraC family transcriptional regulator [Paenibacillus sp. CF384]|uniref:AraC family transcriptional regulator n=1 Tax=Paenibacillus sp. CF384 TaxID=1884382 RepID=UPI000B8A5FC9|nr:AraC family transcriptional regulator [Paenibacillus sp. CF384]
MSLISAFKSKRYLTRIWLTVTLLTVILLLGTSFSIMFTSEKTVLRVQQTASEKVMGQIRYNVLQMNEVVNDTAQSLFLNSDVKVLRYNKGDDELLYQRINDLDTFVGMSSFLHSVFIYNGSVGRWYIGNGTIRAVSKPYEIKFNALLAKPDEWKKMQLIPVDLDQSGSGFRKVDFFSYIMFDAYAGKKPDDLMILNVKSKWLFDNLDIMARDEGKQTGQAYLMDDQGQILNARSKVESSLPELTSGLLPSVKNGITSGYRIMKIDGEKQVVSYMQTGFQNWTIIHTQPYSEVLSQVQRLRWTILLLTVGFLILALLVTVIISKRLYRPFDLMFRSIVSNTPKDLYTEETAGKQADEIAVLSGLYGHMLDRLKTADSSLSENKWILKRYALRRLVQESHGLSPEEWRVEALKNGLAISAEGEFRLCVARVDEAAKRFSGDEYSENKLIHYAISNISEEILARSYKIEIVDLRPDHLVFLLQAKEVHEGNSERLTAMLKEIQQVVKLYYRVSFSVAVSDLFTDCRQWSASYAQTLEYAQYRLFYGHESIMDSAHITERERTGSDPAVPVELERRLVEGIRSGSGEQLEAALDRFFELAGKLAYDPCMHALSYLTMLIKRTVAEVNENKLRPISLDLYRLHAAVLEQETLKGMHEVYRRIVQELCLTRKEEQDLDHNDILMETIKEIVSANYRDMNLSLQSISDMLKMSSVYVGRLFKKAENQSVAEYINDVRLQQTMLLLEKGNYTVNEIMELAGFSNQSHFFRLFKKRFGTTPREYRMKKILS